MRYRISNVFSPYKYCEVDMRYTEDGVLIERTDRNEANYSDQEILESFINSIRDQYDMKYKGYNRDEYMKEVVMIKKEEVLKELEKIELIEKIIGMEIKGD